jgi:hypothetical protein
MSTEVEPHRVAAELLYESAGREISLNFDTMNANLSLAAGALAAVLSVLGAGELFRAKPKGVTTSGLPHLSSVSLLVLALVIPLLLRFFVRTMLAYNNLLRYNRLQKAALAFVDGRGEPEWIDLERASYLDDWKSPRSLGALVWHNLEYGYLWIFVVAAGTYAWAMHTANNRSAQAAAAVIVAAGAAWEIFNLVTSRRSFFERPDEDARCRMHELEKSASRPLVSEKSG